MITPAENKGMGGEGFPPYWNPLPPPTDVHEEAVLREEFGDPDGNGVYAPRGDDE